MTEIKAKKVSQLEEIISIRDSEKYLNSYLFLSYNNGSDDRNNYKIKTNNFISYVYDDMRNKADIAHFANYATHSYLESYYADLNDLNNCKNEVISYLYHELDIAYINEQIRDVADIVNTVSESVENFKNSQYSHLSFHFTHVTAIADENSELDRILNNDIVILNLQVENGYEIINSTIHVDGALNYQYIQESKKLIIRGATKNIIDVYAAAKAKQYSIKYKLGKHIQENQNLGHTPQFVMYDNVARISLNVDNGYEINYVNVNDSEYWITNKSEIWLRVLDSVDDSVSEITVIVQAVKTEYSHIQDTIDDMYDELNTITQTTAYYDVNNINVTIEKNETAYTPYSIALKTGTDTFIVKANTGYTLKDVVVCGAESDFNLSTGVVNIWNATETVVKLLCVAAPKINIVTTSTTNASIENSFPTGVYTHEAYSATIKPIAKHKISEVIVKNTEWFLWNDSRVVFVPDGHGPVEIIVKATRDNAWSQTPIDDRINALIFDIENLQRQIDYYHSDTVRIIWKTEHVILSKRPDHIGDDSYEITITPEPGYSLPAVIDASGVVYEYVVGNEYATLRLLNASSSSVTISIKGVPNDISIIYSQSQFTYVEKPTTVKMGNTVSFSIKYNNLKYKNPICEDNTNIVRDGAIENAVLVNTTFTEKQHIVTAIYTIQPTGQSEIYINPIEEAFTLYHFGVVGDESMFIMQTGTELDGQLMEYPISIKPNIDLSNIQQFVTTNGYNPFSEITYETYVSTQQNNYKYIIIPQEFISIEDEIYIKYNTTKYKIVFDPYKGYNDHGVPQPNGNSKSVFDPITNVEGYIYNIGTIDEVEYYAIYFDLTDSDIAADFALTIINE